MKKAIIIKIKKEDLPKKRAPIITTQKHKTKVMYRRKSKYGDKGYD
jgi:hypothetical protein